MAKVPNNSENRISKAFQKRIKYIIDDNECSIKEFAIKCNLSKDVIYRAVIFGIIPSTKSLIKIADYLNVSLDYLLCETDDIIFFKSEKPTTFALRLVALKTERNTEYSKIAKTMPFTQAHFNDWIKKGFLPSLEYLDALSTYFKVSKDYLLGRTDERD